ncbi:MAG: hypothetical protein J2P21_22545 [Chloracidobacterium sp.]|nr:hypothetical protein [Chloracidobacterium sp.]
MAADERLLELQRILQSKTFSESETLRQMLKFIVEKSVAERADEIKEYTIATEVLGRSSDFSSKTDNIVRVQAARLRKKLAEYYNGEGSQDPIHIFIARGHYYPEYLAAPRIVGPAINSPTAQEQSVTPKKKLSAALNWRSMALGLLILNLAFLTYILWPFRLSAGSPKSPTQAKALDLLWQPFVSSSQPPIIVYSNALFLMSEPGDLYRYYIDANHSLAMGAQVHSLAGLERRGPIPKRLGPLYYFDSYTGIGEVVAAGRISQLLTRYGHDFLIKRSNITSFEDIRNRHVIFLGASLENALLGKLPVESDLVFEEPAGNEFVGRLLIRDRRPEANRPAVYEFRRDDRTKALKSEYALISLLPGVAVDQYILVLAGLSTLGTQAAAEFATSEASMMTLERMCTTSGDQNLPPYFQALLEVQIRDGIAVKTNCLFVRRLSASGI